MKRLFKILIFSLFMSVACGAHAAYNFGAKTGLNNTAGPTGAGYTLNTTANQATLNAKIANVIQIVLSFVGVLFLLLSIYAGFKWMNAQGNDAAVAEAKKILERAIIGLLVVLGAYAITAFVGGLMTAAQVAK
ncbi:hypothetical protein HGA64_01290 [Candidatus Falkowbacteria bacterium]|nr:hypothetical protein [Candidatus Falkowbacteria bacterium]